MNCFKIQVTGRKPITFKTHKEARLHEAFCAGMRKNYSLIYPNGHIKEVEFK